MSSAGQMLHLVALGSEVGQALRLVALGLPRGRASGRFFGADRA
jgi:hypothetical protein